MNIVGMEIEFIGVVVAFLIADCSFARVVVDETRFSLASIGVGDGVVGVLYWISPGCLLSS